MEYNDTPSTGMGSFSHGQDSDVQYNAALEWLYSQLPMFSRTGGAAYKPGLDTSIALDNAFGNPHRSYKTIHIAGTNGKGSVSHTLAAILQSHGYKTALYTSPHLVDFRERMRINGKMIPKEKVIDFVDRFKALNYPGKPSFFELTMMMAFDWFAHENVDIAVIEVGMGGALDSTNIISPLACVITNISADHQQFLGDTPAEIAAQKAGIIKPCIPVIIGEAEGDVKDVFSRTASARNAPIIFAQDNPLLKNHTAGPNGGWDCSSHLCGNFNAALSGDYQLKNINTILAAIKVLTDDCRIELNPSDIQTGFHEVEKLTGICGRWTKIASNPDVICDTGHNEAGIKSNVAQLKRILSDKPDTARLRMVVGFVADKAIDKILTLFPKDAIYYVCNADIPRALRSDILTEKMKEQGFEAQNFGSVKNAWETARKDAGGDDIIFIGGSTFVVADFLANVKS